PLGYIVLHCTDNKRHMAYVIILQNIAANLGGMLTPFGNPQNLYLYSYFGIGEGEFMLAMLPPFAVAVALITLCCFVMPKTPLTFSGESEKMPKAKLTVYLALFALSIAVVFRGIPYALGLVVITVALFFLDREALKRVDYGLLLTFVCFFIFSGNMSRIGSVSALMESLLGGSAERTLFFSAMSCQAISNVPSAILLSKFAESWKPLLYGVNIGGCGTLISSLASLITFRTFNKHNPGHAKRYIVMFSVLNFAFLGVLLLFCLAIV
ncbi:MAG: citrate transporter, partial [Clostridia bacterium]|nr:citrate transporter [Clostridia bacterium]